jgi:hypothetical protein
MMIRRRPLGTLALAALLFSTHAAAGDDEGPRPSGVRFGARSGFAIPAGDAFKSSGALSDTIEGYVPVRLDLGARVAHHFYVGALLQVGFLVANACPTDVHCTGTDVRVGGMIAYHLLPTRLADPWIGAGIGYEILGVKRSSSSSNLDLTASGLELFALELGLDVRPDSHVRIGPVVSATIGRYSSVVLNGTTTRDFETALHGWGTIGIRGMYDLSSVTSSTLPTSTYSFATIGARP